MEQKCLNSLQKRKNIVQSLTEHSQKRRRFPQKPSPELNQPSSSFNEDSSNQSNEIIENSDTESSLRNIQRPNIIINSSSDSEGINTSMIMTRSNTSFYGDDVGNMIPQNTLFNKNKNNEKNINILSVQIIKNAIDISHTDMSTQAEFNNCTQNSNIQPAFNFSPFAKSVSSDHKVQQNISRCVPVESSSLLNVKSSSADFCDAPKTHDSLFYLELSYTELTTTPNNAINNFGAHTVSNTSAIDSTVQPVALKCPPCAETRFLDSVAPAESMLNLESSSKYLCKTQPKDSKQQAPSESSQEVTFLPTDLIITPAKNVYSALSFEKPTLELNSLSEQIGVSQLKESCAVTSAESPTIDLNTLHEDFYLYSPKTLTQTPPVILSLNPPVESSNLVPLHEIHQSFTPLILSNQNKPETKVLDTSQDKLKFQPKKVPAIKFNKSCMDFLSEEEIDFSEGSSDNWTCNESESSESPKNKKKKLTKKKVNSENCKSKNIKPKKEKRVNIRKERKIMKNKGKAYETEKGVKVAEKSMKGNPCERTKCKRGCFDITEERRKALFDFFWGLDPQRRRDWLVNCCRVTSIARKRTDSPYSRRNLTYNYYINNGEDHQKVCQKFLIETLNVTQKYFLYNLSHSKENMSQNDLRIRSIPGKYSPEAKDCARSFIEKLPAVPSHYTRKNTKKLYLPQELKNLSNLYRLYQKESEDNKNELIGESVFREIFTKEYNISFHVPKKDKCLLCLKAERNEVMNIEDKKVLEDHVREKKSTYRRFKAHQNIKRLEKNALTVSFDLQKVLTTPHGNSMLLGYARKLAVFNFTLYESGTQNVYCYIWGECDAKRGSQEIASCLFKYFQAVENRDVSHLILYCDSCAGQNKNKIVLACINYFLRLSKKLQSVQLNFLLPGHTYMPVDSVHGAIEREIQKITVWSPSQWAPYILSARKRPRPYEVIIMDNTDFINWEEIALKTFTKETLKKVQFKNIRIATFKKKTPNQVYIKYSTNEEAIAEKVSLFEETRKERNIYTKITGKGKGKGKGKSNKMTKKEDVKDEGIQNRDFVLRNLYNARLPISIAKYNDLKRLCDSGVIPKAYHQEYLQLPHNKIIKDKLISTDTEDETDYNNDY